MLYRMTEETSAGDSSGTPGEPAQDVHAWHTMSIDTDWVLDILVSIANKTKAGFSVSVTLNLGGSLTFGTLIGGPEWAELTDAALRSAQGPGAEGFADALAPVKRDIESSAADDKEELRSLPLRFLHLKDAWTVLGDGKRYNLGLWRGRLSEVSAWTFGAPTP